MRLTNAARKLRACDCTTTPATACKHITWLCCLELWLAAQRVIIIIIIIIIIMLPICSESTGYIQSRDLFGLPGLVIPSQSAEIKSMSCPVRSNLLPPAHAGNAMLLK
jgi:hypothetical protein